MTVLSHPLTRHYFPDRPRSELTPNFSLKIRFFFLRGYLYVNCFRVLYELYEHWNYRNYHTSNFEVAWNHLLCLS